MGGRFEAERFDIAECNTSWPCLAKSWKSIAANSPTNRRSRPVPRWGTCRAKESHCPTYIRRLINRAPL
jgi:hypothetical protein